MIHLCEARYVLFKGFEAIKLLCIICSEASRKAHGWQRYWVVEDAVQHVGTYVRDVSDSAVGLQFPRYDRGLGFACIVHVSHVIWRH